MTSLSRAGACLAVALILGAAERPEAQGQPPQTQPPPAQTQTQPPAGASAAPPPDQSEKPPAKGQRKTKRTSRKTPSTAQGSFEESRVSRVPGPTQQTLTLTSNVLAGYDDNLTAGLGTGSGFSPMAMAGMQRFTGSLDASLDYFRGNNLRSIRMDTMGSLVGYPGYLDQPAPGGVANVSVSTKVGRDTTFGASERVGYEPFFNVLSPGASSVPLPPGIGQTAPATGLYERRSLSSQSSASLDRRWSRRDSTSLAYSYRVQQFTNDDYGDNSEHDVTADYRRILASGVRARAAYRFADRDYIASDGTTLPTREQRIEGGPDIQSTLSRRRSLTLSLAAGACYLESVGAASRVPYSQWVPVGSGSVTLNLSPTWSLQGGYRRDFSQFRGVTDEVYSTDTAFLSAGGFVTRRTDLRLGATYSNWKTLLASGVNDTLNVYGGSLQVRVALSAKISAFAAYYYYYHQYSNPAGLPAGYPAEYDRNAVRVGLSVWVPLAGTSTRPPLTPR